MIANEIGRSSVSKESSVDKALARGNLAKSAGVVAIFTALSRVSGLMRDLVTSHVFGANAMTDAFVVAFTIPNMMRRFVAEGALTIAFIPVYTDIRKRGGEDEAREFYKATLGLLSVFLVVLVALGVLGSSLMVLGMASGFANDPQKLAMTTTLTQIMFPYVFCISLIGLFMGVLNSRGHFAVTAASPILLNLGMMGGAFWLSHLFAQPMYGLAAGVIVGGVFQLLLHVPVLKRNGLLVWPTFNYRLPGVVRLGRLLVPALFGVAAYQLNLIVLRQIGSYLPAGQIYYYYNADRLMQFALGIFAISIATAALPTMSAQSARGEIKELLETWSFSTKLTNFITIPAAGGLTIVALPIVSVLYLHGQYSWADVQLTAYTTMAFAPSLVGIAMMRTTVQVFYAMEDMRSPVIVSTICVVLNLIFGLALLRYEVVGLATALTLSSFVQTAMLLIWLRRKIGPIGAKSLIKATALQLFSATTACALAWLIARLGEWSHGPSLHNVAVLMASIFSAIITYAALALYFGSEEAQKVWSLISLKLRPFLRR